jgi:N-acetyl-gamma-glutamyl-phosphate reductase
MLHIRSTYCITIPMTSSRSVGVLGASGYAGAELLRLLARHPDLDLAWAAGDSTAGQPLVSRYPGLRAAYGELGFCSVDEGLEKGADVLFCALPHGRAAEIAPRALGAASLVVDLSADFRLRDPGAYPVWYGAEHPFPDELGRWPYGLPELHRDELRGASRIAVPGCYPTAALLALAPLVAAGLVATDGIVVDAKSGLSGAGRSLVDGNLFVQANENVSPYKVGTHRHTPEIEQELGQTVVFTPHLVPVDRGLLASCYARPLNGVPHPDDLRQRYADYYADHPFVEVVEEPPGMRAVQRTNYAQVCPLVDPRGGALLVLGVIDNLGKGAAGQALQNLNLMAGRPEAEGLA